MISPDRCYFLKERPNPINAHSDNNRSSTPTAKADIIFFASQTGTVKIVLPLVFVLRTLGFGRNGARNLLKTVRVTFDSEFIDHRATRQLGNKSTSDVQSRYFNTVCTLSELNWMLLEQRDGGKYCRVECTGTGWSWKLMTDALDVCCLELESKSSKQTLVDLLLWWY